ncbi:MAG: DNA double-strand break repair nuclease NurA, partial [Ktedonobacteraceae bacterium]
FVQSGAGKILLLDGSLYSDLPYLLYNLAIGGYEHFPLRVLEQYLELFALCQRRDILLLGLAKRTRATVLGRAILEQRNSSPISTSYQADAVQTLDADIQDAEVSGATLVRLEQEQNRRRDMHKLPSDGELLHRWTKGGGLTDPVLLGSASFGRASAQVVAQLAQLAKQPVYESALSSAQQRMAARLTPLQERLLAAPAIGTFYVRLAPGEDVLRVDAPASTFGRSDLRLLDFAQALISYTTALPVIRHLVDDYGGLSVYNAALYVVDQEVRLRAETVDHVYLPVLRRQVGYPIQYDRSTRRFNR